MPLDGRKSAAGPRAAEPAPPARSFSFTDWSTNNPTTPQPGNALDSCFDATNATLSASLAWTQTSLNTDGTLRPGTVGQSQLVPGLFDFIAQDAVNQVQPLVDQANQAAGTASGHSTDAATSAGNAAAQAVAASGSAATASAAAGVASQGQTGAVQGAFDARSQATIATNAASNAAGSEAEALDYAVLSQAWAEHMPGPIPPNILAAMNISGDHWSSRWWANQASELVARASGVIISDTAPDPPLNAALWWDSVGCQLYVWYDDGTSQQWVPATSLPTSVTITSAGMAAWFATLPTTPPPASGQPWNNGGTLSFTF